MLKHIKNLLERNAFLIAIVLTALVAFLSLSNPVQIDFDLKITFLDKIFHTFAYFGLSLSWLFALQKYTKHYKLVGFILFFYGVLMEFLQGWLTQNREKDIFDIAANSLGIIIAMLVFNKLYKYFINYFDK